ncbi:hypothetical protein ONS95_000754 [Cadophora gregata]|uniref:uncharacterized protein n=1 Tax=Cadophora gregata TaxID=51156 RepID=UPI0026DAF25C|nr:uncharacterized protein ONS95_000754 [Cadophora gregata]KAK0103069.1 hypothetical protein ONS96_005680 [Cadophora gregata f. sp. sojae]KAK0128804.1 hypothetical protein ONS95_000754 [Cadophora gregata]
MRVAVIGGGPSGLVTLKYLITAHEYFPGVDPIEAKLFEAEGSVGGTFKHRAYEDAELVSSRQLTTFSDYRYTAESPDFLSAEAYCTYLEGYCKQFGLWPHIHLKTPVTSIQRGKEGGHTIHYREDGEAAEWKCDAVAICSGLHVTPNIPDIGGLKAVPTVIHSSQFKEKAQFGSGKNVMIVGSGETGMDLAYMAINSDAKSVTLCHRDGFLCAPKRAPEPSWFGMKSTTTPKGNVPYDVGAASLFDTAYVHPLLRDSFLPWWYYDRFAKYTTWLVSGTKAGLDQWVGEISPERFHASKIFFNKSSKAMPYISAQYRTNCLIDKVRSCIAQVPIVDTNGRTINLAPWPQAISEKGVVRFVENGRPESETMKKIFCKPDVLILATGYTQTFSFLDDSYPKPKDATMRSIWKLNDPSIAFIGFVRPSFGTFSMPSWRRFEPMLHPTGAIPPLAELQSQVWIMSLLNRLPSPLGFEDHYKLHPLPSSRIQYGVDHESYAYQLALDMGSAPSFTDVASKGWKLALCWALSANVNTKFRLVGPWKWSGAQHVMETEIWATVTRRRNLPS